MELKYIVSSVYTLSIIYSQFLYVAKSPQVKVHNQSCLNKRDNHDESADVFSAIKRDNSIIF